MFLNKFVLPFSLLLRNEIDDVEEDKKAKRQRAQAFSKRYRTLLKRGCIQMRM